MAAVTVACPRRRRTISSRRPTPPPGPAPGAPLRQESSTAQASSSTTTPTPNVGVGVAGRRPADTVSRMIAAAAARAATRTATVSNAAAAAGAAAGGTTWTQRARSLGMRATGVAAGVTAGSTGVGALAGAAAVAAAVAPTSVQRQPDGAIGIHWHDVGVGVDVNLRAGLRHALKVRTLPAAGTATPRRIPAPPTRAAAVAGRTTPTR